MPRGDVPRPCRRKAHTASSPGYVARDHHRSCFQAERPDNQRHAIGDGPAAAKGPIIANALSIWGGVHAQSREASQKAGHPNCHRCALACLILRARLIRRRNIARHSPQCLICTRGSSYWRARLIRRRNIADAHLNFNLRARLQRTNRYQPCAARPKARAEKLVTGPRRKSHNIRLGVRSAEEGVRASHGAPLKGTWVPRRIQI